MANCITTIGTLVVEDQLNGSLTLSGPTTLALDSDCSATGSFVATAENVSNVQFTVSGGTISAAGEATFDAADTYTVTVTGDGPSGQLTDSQDVVVSIGDCDLSASSVVLSGPTTVDLSADCIATSDFVVTLNKATNPIVSISGSATINEDGGVYRASFDRSGTYVVSVSASADEGGTVTDTHTIDVAVGDCPQPSITLSGATSIGLTSSCDATTDFTVSMVKASNPTVTINNGAQIIASGSGVYSAAFTGVGTYIVSASADGNDGSTVTDTHQIVVTAGDCKENEFFVVGSPLQVNSGEDVVVSYTGSNIDTIEGHAPDGVMVRSEGGGFVLSATEEGTYTVDFTVTYLDGTTETKSVTFVVLVPEGLSTFSVRVFKRKNEDIC